MLAPAVPELTETHIHECLEARTDQLPQLRELGPPDLIELIKQGPGKSAKQTGFYHNATGVDASSSASLAAYINTLTYTAFDTKTTKIVEGTYCCYNAFSRLDMRVEVTIPGTVESYAVDERGQKRSATDEMWLETYLCSVLRAYSYSDDGSGDIIRKIMGVRRFNPVTTTETEHRFLQAAEELFFRGWQLGSDSLVQVPNNVCNHLCTGLLKYFRATGRFSSGINLFEKLRAKNIEVSSLLAKVMIMGNEEVQAVRVLQDALKETPMDYVLLDTQCAFLKDKALHSSKPELKEERLSWALACADRATIAAPSEFNTWAKLCEIYVAQEDWGNALVTLNSCPMFTYQDKDAPVFPEPREVHLPTLAEAKLDEIESDSARDDYHIHPTLQNLRANAYKGTFKKAYELLTLMSNHVGWDQLLKIRSNVFVMEEEYRHERQPSVAEKSSPSVDVLRGTPDGRSKEGGSTNGDNDSPESATESTPSNKSDPVDHALDTAHAGDAGDVAAANLEVPSETVDKEGVKAGNEDSEASTEQLSRFNNKRLCERWLDSLFMVLYEDLRIYTIWRTEMSQYRAQGMLYKKSPEEWEILGELANRLHKPADGAEAYRQCLAIRFSPKALKGLLVDMENGPEVAKNTREIIQAIIRLVAWQYRWYSEWSPELGWSVRRLIEEEGALKVRSIIQASGVSQGVLELTHHYAALCAAFRSSGTEG